MTRFQSLLIALSIFAINTVRADIVFSDGFTYPDGNLVGVTGSPWSAHSGAGSGPVQVVNGEIEISRSQAEDVDAVLPSGPYSTSGPATALYCSFKVMFTDLPSAGGGYFAHLNNSSSHCRIWSTTTGAADGSFRLGIGNGSNDSATSGQLPTDLSLNTEYTIVVRYDLATAASTLWVNPSAETDAGVTGSDSTTPASISTFAFRQASGIGIMLIDDLIVGTAFADVVGGDLPPTISAIAGQSIPANTNTGALSFAVGDDKTLPADLVVTGSSDNQTLVPDANIVFGGSGATRTVTVTPAADQQGQANISVDVNDGSSSSTITFLLKVGAPSVEAIANQITPEDTVLGPVPFTTTDAEGDALTLSATSSNQLLIPDGNISFAGSGNSRSLTAVPATGQTGVTTITITTDDGHQTTATSFSVTVHPVLGLLVSDDFNRPDGYLVDEVMWHSHSGFYGETQIVGNRMALSQDQSEDVNHWLDSAGTIFPAEGGYLFYASFVANFSELPAGTGTYFAHFKDDTISYAARVFATTNNAAADSFRLGITSNDGDVTHAVLIPQDLTLNTGYLVVVRLNAGTGESRLWVNPTAEDSGYVDANGPFVGTAVQSFAFRQNGPSNGMGVLAIDDLKVGTAFTDVATNLPTPIHFTVSNQNIRLTWPSGQGFTLQRTSELTPGTPATWSTVPFVTEGADDVSNFDVSSGNGFFRLVK
ncbi:hypothetical protein GC207_10780 [bacterium]|nr:hypothetical protein [bacterium]